MQIYWYLPLHDKVQHDDHHQHLSFCSIGHMRLLQLLSSTVNPAPFFLTTAQNNPRSSNPFSRLIPYAMLPLGVLFYSCLQASKGGPVQPIDVLSLRRMCPVTILPNETYFKKQVLSGNISNKSFDYIVLTQYSPTNTV